MRENNHAGYLLHDLRIVRIVCLDLEGFSSARRDLDVLGIDAAIIVQVVEFIFQLCSEFLIHRLHAGYDLEVFHGCQFCFCHILIPPHLLHLRMRSLLLWIS